MNNAKKYILIICGFLIFGGLISVLMKPTLDYDFLAYHIYNGWAFFSNRFETDFLPASYRTCFNPILDCINFWIIQNFNNHPNSVWFISGLKLGIFLLLSYLLGNFLLKNNGIEKKISLISLIILTFMSPILLLLLGLEWTDIQVSNFVLISFFLFIISIFNKFSLKTGILLFISGLLLGMGIGLKYTVFIYVPSIIICVLLFYKHIEHPLKVLGLLISGICLGFIITDGWWMYKIYTIFHNPFFPYFNNIFHSSFGNNSSVLVSDFEHLKETNLFRFLLTPILNTKSHPVCSEYYYYDFKMPLMFFTVLIYIVINKISKLNNVVSKIIDPNYFNIILLFVITSYYINQLVFSQIRYVIVLIPLGSVLIFVITYSLLEKLKNNNLYSKVILLLTIGIIVFYLIKPNFPELFFIIKFLIIIFSLFGIFIIDFIKSVSVAGKNYCCTLLFIVVLTSVFMEQIDDIYINKTNFEKIMDIEQFPIEDGATILCIPTISSAIAPVQNPNVHYITYYLQDKYIKDLLLYTQKARLGYQSTFLKEKIKKIFDTAKNLYIIIAAEDLSYNVDIFKTTYEKSIEEYSNTKIDLYNDCNIVNFSVYGNRSKTREFFICKIK
jgi:hypothetical protein